MSSPVVSVTGALAAIEPATALACAREAARIISFGPHDDVDAAPAAEFIAGSEGKSLPALDLTAKSYASTFNTSGPGSLFSMKQEVRVMSPQSGDGIVNISPTTSERNIGHPSLDLASKSSVEGLTKAATIEVTPSGANVSALAPGPVKAERPNRLADAKGRKWATPINIALTRAGQPEETTSAIELSVPSGDDPPNHPHPKRQDVSPYAELIQPSLEHLASF
jgi:hypothetical protein